MVARRRSTRTSHMPGPPQTFLLGPAPILKGENSETYDNLLLAVSTAVKPTDAIEEIWIKDVADLTWEILRYRRIKESWLGVVKSDALELELEYVLDKKAEIAVGRLSESERAHYEREAHEDPDPLSEETKLVKKWASGDSVAMKQIVKLLSWDNETLDTVEAKAFVEQLDKIEALQRFIATLEARRDAVVREIDRRRAVFAQLLRAKLQDVEMEGEFERVETKTIAHKNT